MKIVLVAISSFLTLATSASVSLIPSDTEQIIRSIDDSMNLSRKPYNYPSCGNYDTIGADQLQPKSVFDWVDSIATAMGVPPGFVKDVGRNESKWPKPNNLNYLIPNGYLQIMPATYKIWYKKLGLTGGNTRYNYLIVGIAYLKYCKDQGDGTWRQARYIYARGRWKNPSQWTKLEHRFMSDIDWKLYD